MSKGDIQTENYYKVKQKISNRNRESKTEKQKQKTNKKQDQMHECRSILYSQMTVRKMQRLENMSESAANKK